MSSAKAGIKYTGEINCEVDGVLDVARFMQGKTIQFTKYQKVGLCKLMLCLKNLKNKA